MSKPEETVLKYDESREYLEKKSVEEMIGQEHVALAVHRLADIVEEFLDFGPGAKIDWSGMEDDEDGELDD